MIRPGWLRDFARYARASGVGRLFWNFWFGCVVSRMLLTCCCFVGPGAGASGAPAGAKTENLWDESLGKDGTQGWDDALQQGTPMMHGEVAAGKPPPSDPICIHSEGRGMA